MKNGFYAFEGALHLLHSGCQIAQPDLEKWNADDCWKGRYDGAADGYVFFAEDIFGEQFALCNERVYRFDPETARVEEMADDLERWASLILERSDYETGYPMARAWQQRHGRLLPGQRLLPKTLFILGGAYDLSNLYAIDAVKGMRFRADVWRQLRSLAPGTKVNLRIEE